MKTSHIDTNFAFAILILVASLVGFVFWLDYENVKMNNLVKPSEVADIKLPTKQFPSTENTPPQKIFAINKLLEEAQQPLIKFPKECEYMEGSHAEGISEGFEFYYRTKNSACPYFGLVSKNISYTLEPHEFGGGHVRRASEDPKSIKHTNAAQHNGKLFTDWIADDMFQDTLYSTLACSPGLSSQYIYIFPENSIIDFAVSSGPSDDFNNDEVVDGGCEAKASILDQKMYELRPLQGSEALDIANTRSLFFKEIFDQSAWIETFDGHVYVTHPEGWRWIPSEERQDLGFNLVSPDDTSVSLVFYGGPLSPLDREYTTGDRKGLVQQRFNEFESEKQNCAFDNHPQEKISGGERMICSDGISQNYYIASEGSMHAIEVQYVDIRAKEKFSNTVSKILDSFHSSL